MQFKIPELHCPFASRLNPATEAVHQQTAAWATSLGLIAAADTRRLVHAERYTWLVGRLFPSAGVEVLQLISDWTCWLFLHDDVCDESALGLNPVALAQQFEQFQALLAGSASPRPDPFDIALEDMRRRFAALAPDSSWMLRFATSVHDYFEACVWEAHNRLDAVVPSVGTFIPLRRAAGGMWIYINFIDLVIGRSLPVALRLHRDVQRLVQITSNVACWHNDIFSLRKEMARGDVHNLVTALEAELHLSTQEAVDVAARYANAEAYVFNAIEAKLPRFGPRLEEPLFAFRDALKAMMRGNLDWSLESGRYRSDAAAPAEGAEPRDAAALAPQPAF